MSIADSARQIPGVAAVASKLDAVDSDTARKAKSYERDHKDRAGVIQAADKRLAR